MHLQILEFSIKFTFPKLIKTTGPSKKIKCEVDEVYLRFVQKFLLMINQNKKSFVSLSMDKILN